MRAGAAWLAAAAIAFATAGVATASAQAAPGCGSFPRPGTTSVGRAPADLSAEYSVLARPRRRSDQVALRRLGALPLSGILPAGIRYLGRAAYGGRAFLIPGRHLLAAPLEPVRCDTPTPIWLRRPHIILVSRVQHQLDTVERQQRPGKIRSRFRRTHNLKAQHIAIEGNRSRHVEYFKKWRQAPNFDRHEGTSKAVFSSEELLPSTYLAVSFATNFSRSCWYRARARSITVTAAYAGRMSSTSTFLPSSCL